MRRSDVARLAGVPVTAVEEIGAELVRQALADRCASVVLDVATQEPAVYWRTSDGRYWLDDPSFGEVVAFDQLDYDPELGLFVREA
ncbi:MAG TPA: hypothetical protein VFS21_16005 [Roseiflexaceae bacterium]|nr:hypothetical protein [Roseiflexaceae bacterium]